MKTQKAQTIEEIAAEIYPDHIVQLSPTFFHNVADVRRHDFIHGYNLHIEEMYSVEEVLKILNTFSNRTGNIEDEKRTFEWFEQFKK